jgi:hypothetical protein
MPVTAMHDVRAALFPAEDAGIVDATGAHNDGEQH